MFSLRNSKGLFSQLSNVDGGFFKGVYMRKLLLDAREALDMPAIDEFLACYPLTLEFNGLLTFELYPELTNEDAFRLF